MSVIGKSLRLRFPLPRSEIVAAELLPNREFGLLRFIVEIYFVSRSSLRNVTHLLGRLITTRRPRHSVVS